MSCRFCGMSCMYLECPRCADLLKLVKDRPELALKMALEILNGPRHHIIEVPRECNVLPHLQHEAFDQGVTNFEWVRQFLLRNYTIYEIAGAFINATSGSIYRQLLELAKPKEPVKKGKKR